MHMHIPVYYFLCRLFADYFKPGSYDEISMGANTTVTFTRIDKYKISIEYKKGKFRFLVLALMLISSCEPGLN